MNLPMPAIHQVTFHKVQLAAQAVLADHAFARNHLELSTELDHHARRLVLTLLSYLLAGDSHEDLETVHVPATWWQAVRERWLPKWWLRRWPVRHRTIVTQRTVTRFCPHVNLKTNDQRHVHLQWLQEPETCPRAA